MQGLKIILITDDQYAYTGVTTLISEHLLSKYVSIKNITGDMIKKSDINQVLNDLCNTSKLLVIVDRFYFNSVLCACHEYRTRMVSLQISKEMLTSHINRKLIHGRKVNLPYDISVQEMVIICEILKGKSTTEISHEYCLSIKRVNSLRREAYKKMGAKSIVHVINRLYRGKG